MYVISYQKDVNMHKLITQIIVINKYRFDCTIKTYLLTVKKQVRSETSGLHKNWSKFPQNINLESISTY